MESLIQLRRMEENLKKIKTKDQNYALRITKFLLIQNIFQRYINFYFERDVVSAASTLNQNETAINFKLPTEENLFIRPGKTKNEKREYVNVRIKRILASLFE